METNTETQPVTLKAGPMPQPAKEYPTEMPTKLFMALVSAMAEMPDVEAEEAEFGGDGKKKSKILAIEKMVKAMRVHLLKHGVIPLPWGPVHVMEMGNGPDTKYGTKTYFYDIERCFRFFHAASGEWYPVWAQGYGLDMGDKALQKAETYAWKNALRLSLMLAHSSDEPDRDDMADKMGAYDRSNRSQPTAQRPANTQREAQQARKQEAAAKPAPEPAADQANASTWAKEYVAKAFLVGEATTEADLPSWGVHFGEAEVACKAGKFSRAVIDRVYRYLRAKWYSTRLEVLELSESALESVRKEINEDKFLKGTEQQKATMADMDKVLTKMRAGPQA